MIKVDDTVSGIFDIIIKEVKNKYNVDLSSEKIYNIINCQIETTKLAITKGISIHWMCFGKFIFTDRRKIKLEIKAFKTELDSDDYNLSETEKDKLKDSFIIAKAIEKQKHIKGSKVQDNTLTLKEVLSDKPKPTGIQFIKLN